MLTLNFWHLYFIFLKIIGLAPMTYNPFKISVIGRIYGVFFLTSFTSIHLFLVIHHPLLQIVTDPMLLTLRSFYVIITFLIVFTTISTLILRARVAVEICSELLEIHRSLKIFDEDYWRKKIDIRLKLLIAVNALLATNFLITEALFQRLRVFEWIIVFNNELASWATVQFVGMVVLMGAMIETINDQFQSANCDIFPLIMKKINVLQEIHFKFIDTTSKYALFYRFIMLICVIKIFFAIVLEFFFIVRIAFEDHKYIGNDIKEANRLLWVCGTFFHCYL